MTTALTDIIKEEIQANGPLSVARYMSLCLTHPRYGYYTKDDPLGTQGDFTTAPEISQLFGEMIGLWFADIWQRMGCPERVILIECGPGRGTLMADFLRGTQHVTGFHEALHISLLEVNATLKEAQKSNIDHARMQWVDTLEEAFEADVPTFVIGNEFLDALPMKQYQREGDGWSERVIGLDEAGALAWGLRPVSADDFFPAGLSNGTIFECAPQREAFVHNIDSQLQNSGGAALFIDYGYLSGQGDTFQAVKAHKPVDVLSHCGEADLTSHVDFKALNQSVKSQTYASTQGAFLKALGIEVRAAQLLEKATSEQKDMIQKACHRLCDKNEMGELFKVMALTNKTEKPAGF